MNLLLDTHIVLWYLAADPKLPAGWLPVIRDPANQVFVSVAAVWETTIKYEAGKLALPAHPADYIPQGIRQHLFQSLPIDAGSVGFLRGLSQVHRDPFDRIQVAQARQFDLTVLTVDANVRRYPVKLLPP